jgi:hypothetical protein
MWAMALMQDNTLRAWGYNVKQRARHGRPRRLPSVLSPERPWGHRRQRHRSGDRDGARDGTPRESHRRGDGEPFPRSSSALRIHADAGARQCRDRPSDLPATGRASISVYDVRDGSCARS